MNYKSCIITICSLLIIVCIGFTVMSNAVECRNVENDSISTPTTQTNSNNSNEIVIGTEGYILLDLPIDDELQMFIQDKCNEYGIEYQLVLAMIEQESNFDINAVSETNDYGLMQLNGRSDLMDPYENVTQGIKMISVYVDKYEDYNLALMCYNCGEYGASLLWDDGVYSTEYSRAVLDKYNYYCNKM